VLKLTIDDREVRRALARLRVEGPKAIADALNRTGFEILDAEEKEVRGAFKFASPNTAQFLARGFAFDKATPSNLAVTIRTKPGARTILERQTFGATVAAGEPDVGPRLGSEVAVPVNVARGARGKIPAAKLPGRVIRRNAKGRSRAFVAGRAVLERLRGGGVRLLYALAPRVTIPSRLHFFEVAAATARREFPRKAHRVLEKLSLARRGPG
jgi:hypothetical protein